MVSPPPPPTLVSILVYPAGASSEQHTLLVSVMYLSNPKGSVLTQIYRQLPDAPLLRSTPFREYPEGHEGVHVDFDAITMSVTLGGSPDPVYVAYLLQKYTYLPPALSFKSFGSFEYPLGQFTLSKKPEADVKSVRYRTAASENCATHSKCNRTFDGCSIFYDLEGYFGQ
eukprot:TRINITY_DN768_c0_g1_i3.p3 TRINITY_DN768_c0_g1~~TRINITY_DN768_c0_g1_i3.p3  ORF type:complete len:170 (-),score=24.61 TRINITY_DN768_c0_g1_i3:26-535(-)